MNQDNDRKKPLDDVRKEIDRVDDAIHDLLMRRAELAAAVVRAKQSPAESSTNLRPGREVQILRRLAARHQGAMAFSVVAHVMRELIAASLRQQGPFGVVVPAGAAALRHQAEVQFGVLTPLRQEGSAKEVLEVVRANPHCVGVLPLDGPDPWWRWFVENPEAGLHVIARLPFFPTGNPEEALVVAAVPWPQSVVDYSVAVFEWAQGAPEIPAGAAIIARSDDAALIQLEGNLAVDDPKWHEWRQREGVVSVSPAGGYAAPVT